jgi:hypothetical protein
VFDLAGRTVARPLRDALLSAGQHKLRFDRASLPAVSISAGSVSDRDKVTRKLLVIDRA